MSALDKALIAMVSSGADWVTPHVEALRAAGAHVRVCAPDRSLWSILTALDYEVIVLTDVDGGWTGLVRALEEDEKLRAVPAIALQAPGAACEPDAGITLVDAGPPEETVRVVESLVWGPASRRSVAPAALGTSSSRPSTFPPDGARRELEAGFHDLRVLLGIIVGYGANLRDGAGGSLSDPQRDHVLKMIEAAADAKVILEQTMAASRSAALGVPSSSARGGKRTHVDVSALATAVVRMFSKAAEQRGIELACAAPDAIHLWANAVHLKQVVANLVVNALKFTPPGGRVRVTTRMAPGAQAEIVVSDSGPGVPPEQRARIFEHGVRLERDAGIGGTGVGLAVVRELVVEQHGGQVQVGEAEGGGAEFVVSLPLDRRARPRETAAVARDAPGDPDALAREAS